MAGGGAKGPDNTPIDAELARAGGFGCMQIFTTLTVILGIMSVNLLTHGIAILELPPKLLEPDPEQPDGEPGYICTTDAQPNGYPCYLEEACSDIVTSFDVNYDASEENIYNWYTKLELGCKPKSQTTLISLCCMVGIFLGVLVIPRLGDLVGRKPIFFAALWGSIPTLAVVCFVSKLSILDAATFLAGPCIIARMSCGFLMLMEHMERKNQAKVGALVMVSEGLCQVLWVFFLTVISKDSFYFMYFALGLNVVTAIACYWVPESPRYLYGINDIERCQQVFAYIAKFNGIENYQVPRFEVEFAIECVDADNDARVTDVGKTKDRISTTDNNFSQVLSERGRTTTKQVDASEDQAEDRQTTTMGRYMTVSKANNNLKVEREGSNLGKLTKRETISYMHETVTGVRQTGAFWVIGVDRTQSIAIDEVFSQKPVHEGAERNTMTLRNTKARNSIMHSQSSDDEEEDDTKEVPTSVMRGSGLCSGRTAVNLVFMVCLWVISCVNYGMINIYMKYVPGTIYLNFTTSGLSEIAAHVFVGALFVKLTPRWTFFIGYAVSLVGSIFLIFQNKFTDTAALIATFVLCAKFGISMAMCACYVSTPYIFPVVLSGTAFGICNIFGRFFAIGAPILAEKKIPLPMEVFSVLSIAGLVLCLFISTSDDVAPQRKSESKAAIRSSEEAAEPLTQ